MKRCPECRKDYIDDCLMYGLDDAVALGDWKAYLHELFDRTAGVVQNAEALPW